LITNTAQLLVYTTNTKKTHNNLTYMENPEETTEEPQEPQEDQEELARIYFEESTQQQNRIKSEVDSIQSIVAKMQEKRNQLQAIKQKAQQKRTKQLKNQKLFSGKITGLTKKKDFHTQVATKPFFSNSGFLEHGPYKKPLEKEATFTPNRVFDHSKWAPSDSVSAK